MILSEAGFNSFAAKVKESHANAVENNQALLKGKAHLGKENVTDFDIGKCGRDPSVYKERKNNLSNTIRELLNDKSYIIGCGTSKAMELAIKEAKKIAGSDVIFLKKSGKNLTLEELHRIVTILEKAKAEESRNTITLNPVKKITISPERKTAETYEAFREVSIAKKMKKEAAQEMSRISKLIDDNLETGLAFLPQLKSGKPTNNLLNYEVSFGEIFPDAGSAAEVKEASLQYLDAIRVAIGKYALGDLESKTLIAEAWLKNMGQKTNQVADVKFEKVQRFYDRIANMKTLVENDKSLPLKDLSALMKEISSHTLNHERSAVSKYVGGTQNKNAALPALAPTPTTKDVRDAIKEGYTPGHVAVLKSRFSAAITGLDDERKKWVLDLIESDLFKLACEGYKYNLNDYLSKSPQILLQRAVAIAKKNDAYRYAVENNLTVAQAMTVASYTSRDYDVLNPNLRNKTYQKGDIIDCVAKTAKTACEALPPLSDKVTKIFRGIDIDGLPQDIKNLYLTPGSVIAENAFTSCSASRPFSKPTLIILNPNHKNQSFKNIMPISTNGKEGELLAAPGIKWKIDEVITDKAKIGEVVRSCMVGQDEVDIQDRINDTQYIIYGHELDNKA
jgi:hypothetical protein